MPATYSQHIRKRVLLQQLIDLPDTFTLTLEASIPLLHGLSILPTFSTISHLQEISDMQRNKGENWELSDLQLWECRVISSLWAVLDEESVEMREFK